MQNHFDLFQLPQRFEIDSVQLDAAYRQVQSRVHPDKFVQAGDAEKRIAMQWATQANEAYRTLKDPLKRASYLCLLHGVDLQTDSNTSMPTQFLMQQMEWRESFDDARQSRDSAALMRLEREVTQALLAQMKQAGIEIDAKNFQAAAQDLRACLFLEKLIADIAALDDA